MLLLVGENSALRFVRRCCTSGDEYIWEPDGYKVAEQIGNRVAVRGESSLQWSGDAVWKHGELFFDGCCVSHHPPSREDVLVRVLNSLKSVTTRPNISPGG